MIGLSSDMPQDPNAINSLRLCSPLNLTAEELSVWHSLLRGSPDLQSPFFHPAYFAHVEAICRNVTIAVVRENGVPVGYFPFQRQGSRGVPVGGRLADFQGVIGRLPSCMNARQLIAGCKLSSWDYDHLPASQTIFRDMQHAESPSPYIDLTDGWGGYVEHKNATGTRIFSETARKQRKLTREVGPVRYVRHSDDPSVFQNLLSWKTEQRNRTGTFDVLQRHWATQVLERCWQADGDGFRGRLSALYAGQTLVAAHLGLATPSVTHYWFPAYEPAFAAYSPGTILFLEMAQTAAAEGAQRIDMGKGTERFKKSPCHPQQHSSARRSRYGVYLTKPTPHRPLCPNWLQARTISWTREKSETCLE